jgi:cobyrinic acid a,c-diamide synthase
MARSLAALAQGYARFDPELTWAGLAANQTGSPRHAEILARAMEQVPELPFLGGLPRRPDLALPERHLGLITAEEGGFGPKGAARLADWVEQALDLDALLERLPRLNVAPPAAEPPSAEPRIRLGVARDQAFCFYYQENLRRLEEAGAELVFFSPREDAALPPGLDGLYLGGGYPELFAARLSANRTLCEEIAAQGRAGLPIYAECGGMIYLARRLTDLEGVDRPMAGLLPLDAVMLPRLRSLGYRQVTLAEDAPLGPAGAEMRGHEFHYSEISRAEIEPPHSDRVYRVRGSRGAQPEVKGFRVYNTLASYVHLHFGSRPDLAPDFVDFCRLKNGAAPGRRAPSGPAR